MGLYISKASYRRLGNEVGRGWGSGGVNIYISVRFRAGFVFDLWIFDNICNTVRISVRMMNETYDDLF